MTTAVTESRTPHAKRPPVRVMPRQQRRAEAKARQKAARRGAPDGARHLVKGPLPYERLWNQPVTNRETGETFAAPLATILAEAERQNIAARRRGRGKPTAAEPAAPEAES